MSTIFERRKQELTTEINKMVDVVQFFIDNKKRNEKATSISKYLDLNGKDLGDVKQTLHTIKLRFNPESDSFDTFENCKNQLEELQKEITKIQSRGEAEQERLRKNSESLESAFGFAGIGAVLGGIALGLGGCISCMSNGTFQPPDSNGPHIDIPLFNLITGLLIGVVGGALIGAMIGAIKGQGEIAIWLIGGCLLVGISVILGIRYFTSDTVINSKVSYDIPAIHANATSIRFYEKGESKLELNKRNYGHVFTKSKTRYVSWELNLEHPQHVRRADFNIKAILYSADGSIVSEQTLPTYIDADWIGSYHSDSWGQNKYGNWQVGSYRVELYIDGKIVANDSFTVR
jgi:hypothetical protein